MRCLSFTLPKISLRCCVEQPWQGLSNISFHPFQPYLKPGEGPIVLVLAPTRELAVQIKEECDKFGASSEIKNTVVYGGVPKHKQVRTLREGIEIVIATPVSAVCHFLSLLAFSFLYVRFEINILGSIDRSPRAGKHKFEACHLFGS